MTHYRQNKTNTKENKTNMNIYIRANTFTHVSRTTVCTVITEMVIGSDWSFETIAQIFRF